ANRQLATSPELARYRIIHFATHGILDDEHPELSGLVLSLVDKQGQTQNGFLRLHEVYNLKLSSAELIVLSACHTAIGRRVRGEGLIGLTRGFMAAGAPRVVASLWRVDDASTANLMKGFYQAMLGRQALSPAGSLRASQLAMFQQTQRPEWRAPYYCAGFMLQGEWRKSICDRDGIQR